jgi:hypothetical protein
MRLICSVCLRPQGVTSGNLYSDFHGHKKFFFSMARQPRGGLGRLIFFEASRSHFLDTPQSVGLLWTRDQLVAETST